MKKIIYTITSTLFFTTIADAETVRIYNGTHNQMLIHYQSCFRDVRQFNKVDCIPETYNTTIPRGQPYTSIALSPYTDLIRVISASELDAQGTVQAQGDFPGEEDCKAFPHYAVMLGKNSANLRRLICKSPLFATPMPRNKI